MPREEGAPSSEWLHGTVTLWAPDQVTQAHSEFILPVQSRIGHPPPSTAPDEPARRSRLTTAICELYELARVCHTAYSVHTGQALLGPRPSPRDPLSHARRLVGSQSLEGHQPLSGDRKPCCQIPHVQHGSVLSCRCRRLVRPHPDSRRSPFRLWCRQAAPRRRQGHLGLPC